MGFGTGHFPFNAFVLLFWGWGGAVCREWRWRGGLSAGSEDGGGGLSAGSEDGGGGLSAGSEDGGGGGGCLQGVEMEGGGAVRRE